MSKAAGQRLHDGRGFRHGVLRRADCVCKSILAELKGAIAVRHACVDRGVQEHLRKIVRRHSRAQRSANLHV